MSKLAIIGGSGAYKKLELLSDSIKLNPIETPFGFGANIYKFQNDKLSYYFLSRHGDKGYHTSAATVNYRANIWSLKSLGVERIISWSGPGIINPKLKVGSLAVPDDIIDLTKQRPSTFFTKQGLGFIRFSNTFCPSLRQAIIEQLSEENIPFTDKATYLCTEGPRLETRAEIRMFDNYGADLVGMTLAPETFLARELEICYSAICYLTNFAEGVLARNYEEGELFEGMQTAEEKKSVDYTLSVLPAIAVKALGNIANSKRECDCKNAMLRYRKQGTITDDWRKWIDP
ncbi:MAG: MTAP family purine nucleoside phosphorylase [Nitrospinota bacterium]